MSNEWNTQRIIHHHHYLLLNIRDESSYFHVCHFTIILLYMYICKKRYLNYCVTEGLFLNIQYII